MSSRSTIVAVSSPSGRSERAIVRLSGSQAVGIAERLFRRAGDGAFPVTFRIYGGFIDLPDLAPPFPALMFVMLSPGSYTREDVVEFHVPGSPPLVEMLVESILRSSPAVRLAEPGEFTRRAFLNGRIDLLQAEAVLGIVRSRTDAELRRSMQSLAGTTSHRIRSARDALVDLRAGVESALDFSDQDIELAGAGELLERARSLCGRLAAIVSDGASGDALSEDVDVVICGPPNAGKSTLFNALIGSDAAFVSETPGTTRDALRAAMELDGIQLRLVDCAGLREEASDSPGHLAVVRSRELLQSARLAIFVLDRSVRFEEPVVEMLLQAGWAPRIIALNKSDLPAAFDADDLRTFGINEPIYEISAMTGCGLDRLKAAIGGCILGGDVDVSAWACMLNLRQREAARCALEGVQEACSRLSEGALELAAIGLQDAADAVSEICGDLTSEDVLDAIFSQFCIGK